MFVVTLRYEASIEEIEKHIGEHQAYLFAEYDAGRFVLSGRLVPRTGGLILARGSDRDEIQATVERDPLVRLGLASPTIVQFEPTAAAEGLEFLYESPEAPRILRLLREGRTDE